MDKEWEELWKALREMEQVDDEQMRERLRQRDVLWFQKEEQKEAAG